MTLEAAVISTFRDFSLKKRREVFDCMEVLLVREEQSVFNGAPAIAQASQRSLLKNPE